MKTILRVRAGLLILSGLLGSTAHAQTPVAFAACAACHSSDGTNGLGPSIKGIYGRKAATTRGFSYSPAMKRSDLTWNDETLDAFIADPQKAIPGNLMPFPGIADAGQRAEIVEYLKTTK